MSIPPQMSPEDLIMQAAGHLRGPSQEVHMDGSMGSSMAHQMAYQQHQQAQHHSQEMHRHPLPVEQFAANASFTEGDTSMMDREDNVEGDSVTHELAQPRSGSLRSSANNELEMRQLFSQNKHRGLQDVASELHGNERGPNSERTRQVFAMLWINSVCSTGKGSVPRGRVYANYASRCATERITVLNPASFGKLVRVLFPGLKTRRLGVRGESKYHYVNFALVDDQPETRESQVPAPRLLSEPRTHASQSFQSVSVGSHHRAASSAPPSQPMASLPGSGRKSATKSASRRTHSLYNQPDLSTLDSMDVTSTKTILELAFISPGDESMAQSDLLALPPIEQYLPPGTDPDAAKSLSALYRSHCTSLVECIRYCKEKTFFHLYTSFQGTLTMPVHKLFSHPALAPWIEGCDLVLYQNMMRIISKLTLQVLPKPVLDTLRAISERLIPHIRESFQGQPAHVLRAKETPATLFAGLLDRALRVNLTAHAAANMLSNPANRDQMYVEWITMIKPRKVAECVPTRGMDDTVALLVNEMRDLLDPQNVPWDIECLTIYGDVAVRAPKQSDRDNAINNAAHNVLDKWVNLLQSLTEKFPYASPSDIVWCVERIGTSVMRDITLSSGKSFGSWWVTKTWMDEMVCFLAEQGGFMKRTVTSVAPDQALEETSATKVNARQQSSRYSSGSDDLNLPNMSQSQPGRAPFPPVGKTKEAAVGMGNVTDAHDDSGIGIRTPDDDFTVDKFTFSPPPSENLGLGREASQGVA
ncbi:hypothetical protein NLU13_1709 [Sarocladium strictum]|nr:hypothetical protein NLU13_1709 [Sarocladium strictum]